MIIRGNSIQDEGLDLLSEALLDNNYLEELDISANKITPVGIACIA